MVCEAVLVLIKYKLFFLYERMLRNAIVFGLSIKVEEKWKTDNREFWGEAKKIKLGLIAKTRMGYFEMILNYVLERN
jgi:hypothetical protein